VALPARSGLAGLKLPSWLEVAKNLRSGSGLAVAHAEIIVILVKSGPKRKNCSQLF